MLVRIRQVMYNGDVYINMSRYGLFMFRTQIYLTEMECNQLNLLSRATGKHKSALIRDAIDQFILAKHSSLKKKKRSSAAGLWAERKDLPNYRELRDEFDRKIID